jgi:hypothetical protein
MSQNEVLQKKGRAMTHGFQQQTALGFPVLKSVATPQHGQKPVMKKLELKEPKSFKPPPAHA